MLRTLAAEAARRYGQRVSFTAVRPATQAESAPRERSGPGEGSTDKPPSVAEGWRLSYLDLDRMSDEAAAGLAFRGVLPGDVVALVLPTTPEFPICYLAAIKIGAIVAGLDPRWPPVLLDRLTDLLRPTVTVAPFGLNVGPGPDGELVRITVARNAQGVLAGLRRAELPPPPLPPDPGRPAVIAFNSGRSATPRGAVFGVRQLDAIRAAEAGDRWGGGTGAVTLSAVPFAHYTFMTRVPAILQSGQTWLLMDSWRPEHVPRIAAAAGANRLTGLPAQLAELAAQPYADGTELPQIELVVTANSAVPAGLVLALRKRFGTSVAVSYGCTEAGLGLATYPDDVAAADVDGCVGYPVPGVTLALRDSGGHEVTHGETGEVLLRSAACMSGYWNDPQASAAAFTRDRFVRTGDLGRLEEEGRLVLAGRAVP